MSYLPRQIVTEAMAAVDIVYVDHDVAKRWNARRHADDTMAFCGWFWVRTNGDECGPFKTRSACIRDAYYKFIERRDVPSMDIQKTLRQQRAQARKRQREASRYDEMHLAA